MEEVTQQQESNTNQEEPQQKTDEVVELKTQLANVRDEMDRMKQFFSSKEFIDIVTNYRKTEEPEQEEKNEVDMDEIVSRAVKQVQNQMLSQSIESARKKYSDFDALKPMMIKLAQVDPSLGVEELYTEAKNYKAFITERDKKSLNHRVNQHNTTSVVEVEKEVAKPKKPATIRDIIYEQMRKLNIGG